MTDPAITNSLDSGRRDTRAVAICCAILVLAVVATMSRLFTADFTYWDDNHTVSENPDFAPPSLASLGRMWLDPNGKLFLAAKADLYVPVTYTAWWTIAKLTYTIDSSGSVTHNPRAFHAANVAIHACAALVVFALLRSLLRFGVQASACMRVNLCALAGALVFALHPLQVESIGWVSGLKDVLSGALSALALWQYVLYAQLVRDTPRPDRSGDIRARITRCYIFAAVAFVLAMLAKPSAVVVPLVILPIDFLLLRRKPADVARGVIPLLLFAVPIIVIAREVQAAHQLTNLVSHAWRPLVALDALAFYLWKSIWPAQLAFDYGRSPRFVVEGGLWKLTWFVPLAFAAVALLLMRRAPALLAGTLVSFLAILPVLGLTPFDMQEYSTVADHYCYVPMIGVALTVAGTLSVICRRQIFAGAISICFVAIAIFAVRSFDQTRAWANSRALFEHAIAVNPRSWVSHQNLAATLLAGDDFEGAMREIAKSIRMRDNFAPAYMVLGEIYYRTGDAPRARRAFEKAQSLQRTSEGHTNLALLYAAEGRMDEAVEQYQHALRLNPRNPIARRQLPLAIEYRNFLRWQASTRPATRATPATAPTTSPAARASNPP